MVEKVILNKTEILVLLDIFEKDNKLSTSQLIEIENLLDKIRNSYVERDNNIVDRCDKLGSKYHDIIQESIKPKEEGLPW